MAAAGEVDAPEPSPLFWDSQLRRIQQSVAAERLSRESSWFDRGARSRVAWLLAPAGILAIVVAVVFSGGRLIAPRAGGSAAPVSRALWMWRVPNLRSSLIRVRARSIS